MLSFALILFVSLAAAVCPDKQGGLVNWSQKFANLARDANVTIAAGEKVLLDKSPATRLHTIEIKGELIVDTDVEKTINFEVFQLYVNGADAKLIIGTLACPVLGQFELILYGKRMPEFSPRGVGTKGIGVLNGLLEIHGRPMETTWAQLSEHALKGSTKLVLADDVTDQWAKGDAVVVTSTEFEDQGQMKSGLRQTQNEDRIVKSVDGNVVTLTEPLTYSHYGKKYSPEPGAPEIDMRGEVALLTRNVVIRGDISMEGSCEPLKEGQTKPDCWGAHIMVLQPGTAKIAFAEITAAGQAGELARYPIHFHVARDQTESYILGNSIHHTFQRCVTVHGTDKLLVQNNVGYLSKGHCFFIEDGNELHNVFRHNIAISPQQHSLLGSDKDPACFWITKAKNHFFSNTAVGGTFGFWYAMPEHPFGFAQIDNDHGNWPRYEAMGDFVGNRAHGADDSGLFIDKGQENGNGDATQSTSYRPRDWSHFLPLLPDQTVLLKWADWQRSSFGLVVDAVIHDFTAFKCRDFGLWGRGDYMMVNDYKSADNGVGAQFPGEHNLLMNSMFVGDSDNNFDADCVGCPSWAVTSYNELGRRRPNVYWKSKHIIGYQSYDAGGGDLVINSKFFNFKDELLTGLADTDVHNNRVRKAAAFSAQTGPNVLNPKNFLLDNTFKNVDNKFFFVKEYPYWSSKEEKNYWIDTNTFDDAMRGITFIDFDGKLTGACGSTVVGSAAHLRRPACEAKPEWNAHVCPPSLPSVRPLSVRAEGTGQGNVAWSVPNGHKLSDRMEPDVIATIDASRLWVTRVDDGVAAWVNGDEERDLQASTGGLYPPGAGVLPTYGTNVRTSSVYLLSVGGAESGIAPGGTIRVSLSNLAPGEFARVAVPYPAGTTFQVYAGWSGVDGDPVPPAADMDHLAVPTKLTLAQGYSFWFFDQSSSLLWLHLQSSSPIDYQWYGDVDGTGRFPLPDGLAMVTVKAACGSFVKVNGYDQCAPSAGAKTAAAVRAVQGTVPAAVVVSQCHQDGPLFGGKQRRFTVDSSVPVYTIVDPATGLDEDKWSSYDAGSNTDSSAERVDACVNQAGLGVHCAFGRAGSSYWGIGYRTWKHELPALNPAHNAMKIELKADAGFGLDLTFRFSVQWGSHDNQTTSVSLSNPEYGPGQVGDQVTAFHVPFADLDLVPGTKIGSVSLSATNFRVCRFAIVSIAAVKAGHTDEPVDSFFAPPALPTQPACQKRCGGMSLDGTETDVASENPTIGSGAAATKFVQWPLSIVLAVVFVAINTLLI